VHSSSPYYEPNVRQYDFNPAKAEALLDEMGLKKGANGVRTSIKLLGLPYGEVWNRAAESTRQALRRVGIEVVLESTDAAGWVKRLGDWEFEMIPSPTRRATTIPRLTICSAGRPLKSTTPSVSSCIPKYRRRWSMMLPSPGWSSCSGLRS
jgi:ABC-type transport system substrate-binding protein